MPVPSPSLRLTTTPAAKPYVSHSSAYAIKASSAVILTVIASPARYHVRSVSISIAQALMESTIAVISDNSLLFIFNPSMFNLRSSITYIFIQ